jgi:hypothetical protein
VTLFLKYLQAARVAVACLGRKFQKDITLAGKYCELAFSRIQTLPPHLHIAACPEHSPHVPVLPVNSTLCTRRLQCYLLTASIESFGRSGGRAGRVRGTLWDHIPPRSAGQCSNAFSNVSKTSFHAMPATGSRLPAATRGHRSPGRVRGESRRTPGNSWQVAAQAVWKQ